MGVGAFERNPEGFDEGKLVGESVESSDGGKVNGASEGAFDGTELFGAAEGVEVTGVEVSVGDPEKAVGDGVGAAVGDFDGACVIGCNVGLFEGTDTTG